MPFDGILGQEKAVTLLRNAFRNGRIAHAYLFIGPEGVGKRLTALTLTKALNCQSPPEPAECCEKCPSCLKFNSSNHADLILLEPEGEVIKIGQIRDMQKRLRFRPLEGGSRACILDCADRMNEEASNGLLKTLEEPPEATYVFLVTSRPHRLLPTILSRCQWVKFKPLSTGHIVDILQRTHGIKEDQARFYASLAGGSAQRAQALSNRVDFQKRVNWLDLFSSLSLKTTEEIFDICEKASKEDEEIPDLLDLWKTWIRDLVFLKAGGKESQERLINQDLESKAAGEAEKWSFDRLDRTFQMISEIQSSLAYNVNKQLALETLMLEIRKQGNGETAKIGFAQINH